MDTKALDFTIDPLAYVLIAIKIFPYSITIFEPIFPFTWVLIMAIVPVGYSKANFLVLDKITLKEYAFFALGSSDFLSLFPLTLK